MLGGVAVYIEVAAEHYRGSKGHFNKRETVLGAMSHLHKAVYFSKSHFKSVDFILVAPIRSLFSPR